MSRSAWGLCTPSDLPWQARARCADKDVDPDWWSSVLVTDLGRAVHECRWHCPVREECEADAKEHPGWVVGTVRAGFFHGRMHQPAEVCCESCRWLPLGLRPLAGVR